MSLDKKRWILLIICLITNICVGFMNSWSVFQRPMQAYFGWDLNTLALAYSIMISAASFPMIAAGVAKRKFSPRVVMAFGGILMGVSSLCLGFTQTIPWLMIWAGLLGVGTAFVYPVTVATMIPYFPERRGMISGLLAAAMGSGSIVWAPLSSFLIERTEVLTPFKIYGVLFLVLVCGLGMILRAAPEDYVPQNMNRLKKAPQPPLGAQKDWKEMLLDKQFYLIFAAMFFGSIPGFMVIGHASPMLQENVGFTPAVAATFVGFLGLTNMGGRLIWGMVSDRVGRYQVYLIAFIYYIVILTLLWTTNIPGLYVFALLSVGFCFGGFMGTLPAVTADAFGSKNLDINFGALFFSIGFSSLAGPNIASAIRTSTESYAFTFALGLLFAAAGLILTFALLVIQRKRRAR